MPDQDASLIATRHGPVGHLLMNRPRTLNALDLSMIEGFTAALADWQTDPHLRLVLLEGAGGRAFCAGGDVRRVRELVLAGDRAGVEAFFAAEYAVNGAIAAFPLAWVSLIDGVCMGGGLGVSVHGSHRIVTEKAMLAMPETAIALFPDVGTSHVLPRLDSSGAMGRWLAVTGARLSGAEAVEAGLATHFVPSERLEPLRAALFAEGDAAQVKNFARPVPPGRIAALRPAIERCFGSEHRAGIEAALEAEEEEAGWAAEQLAILRRVSPTSVAVTLELLRRAATLDLPHCLELELALTRNVTAHPDFAEGVRALLVDKDNAPRWQPAPDARALAALFE
ncbi:enoyl-CoA hydratase/isomerase family protein [Pseudoroseomonas globiformis]|uniref:3-hydroxyisobutyryl-CoA hydrolase n=1 Tax=Teichococcus globiformis TaxID=2307229 RepID=A0ABV7G1N3_9PROT